MLKKEPKLLHLYEEISTYPGSMIMIEGENPDEKKYKSIGTYRRAFVGDMQSILCRLEDVEELKNYPAPRFRVFPEYILDEMYQLDISPSEYNNDLEEWLNNEL